MKGDLTEDEVALLDGDSHLTDSVRTYIKDRGGSLGAYCIAFNKLARAARAENRAILETAVLEQVRRDPAGRAPLSRTMVQALEVLRKKI